MSHKPDVPEEIQKLLKKVVTHFAAEDVAVRERQLRQYKQLKYYWNGFQRLWWSEVAHDWRVFDDVNQSAATSDQSFYDKRVNVFKAYLESIIAALSVTVPPIKCFPDDADNPEDIETAKAGDIISKLVYRHNDVTLLWLHALYIYCTEGLIAAYNYSKEDPSYGKFETEDYENAEEEVEARVCPICRTNLPDKQLSDAERNEYDPDNDDILAADALEQGDICPQCMVIIHPEIVKERVIVPRFVGVSTHPKSRQCIEVYGGLFVKVPNYARSQKDIPYLIYSYEEHFSKSIERYEHLRSELISDTGITTDNAKGGDFEPYERWARMSIQYMGEFPAGTVTVRSAWLRPCAFNVLTDDDDVKALQKRFPNGCKVVFVNDLFAEAVNESLDDHWTLTHNPLSDYLHHDPLGMLLTSIQEITNDLVSLVLQTIEHGIPQTFADQAVVDFESYRQMETTPGAIYPATPKSGKSVSDAFYEVKTAALSHEVLPFAQNIQEMGQLVSGALPSLFGGEMGGSKTAAQYSMSRAQALQRLQTPWKMLQVWWKQIFGKVIPSYMKDIVEEEKFVEKDVDGNFVNVVVRKSQLTGKLGNIELEASEELPITWSQQRDVIMQLMQAGNPQVFEALTTPENLQLVARAIGLDNFSVPGDDDRQKQYEEINQLLATEPIDEMVPSVDIEPAVDNNELHADICRRWAVSEAGRLAKVENPAGYKNVLLHMQRHVTVIQAMQAMNAAQAAPPNSNQQPMEQENVERPETVAQ